MPHLRMLSSNDEQLALAHQTARMATWEWIVPADKLNWAPESTELYSRPLREMDSIQKWLTQVHSDEQSRVWAAMQSAVQTGDEYVERFRASAPDGGFRWILARGRVFQNDDGLMRMLGINMDVTEAIWAQEALFASEARFRATFEQAAMGIAHIGLDGRWQRVNRRCCEILGYSDTELLALTFADVTHPEDIEADWALVNSLLRRERYTYSMEKRYFRRDRQTIWVNITVSLVRKENDDPDYFISVIEDITARRKIEAERDALIATLEERVRERTAALEQLSMTDSLTGIANRRCYDQRLEAEWIRAVRTRQPLSVVMIDVDHFKAINDNFGHAAGDDALVKIANCLTSVAKRDTDVVSRYGGEEFCLLLPDTDAPNAIFVAEKVAAAIRELGLPNPASKPASLLTVSQGVATAWPGKKGTGEGLLLAADRAMYKAKQGGRQRICVAEST